MKLEFRSLLNNIFGGKAVQPNVNYTDFKQLQSLIPYFYNYDGDLYDHYLVRSIIHCIASHAAKLTPKHLVKGNKKDSSNIESMLSLFPNPYMSCYDFIYKVVSLLYSSNNVFIYVRYENGKLQGLYPINYSSVKLLEYQNDVYVQFLFMTGQQVTIPISELIYLRRHYNRSDMFGESALKPLYPTLNLDTTINQGIVNAIKSSAGLRGLLKFTNQLRPEDLKAATDSFVKNFMDVSNNGGVAATDSKADYIPLKMEPITADDKQKALVEEAYFRYFNISKKILTSEYNEIEFNAFYSSTIEPLAIQMSQWFTHKLFTDTERGHGNEIFYSANRLMFATSETKANVIKALMPLGLISVNEGREMFEMSPLIGDEYNKHLQSLNFVDLKKANKYQLGEDGNDDDKNDGEAN